MMEKVLLLVLMELLAAGCPVFTMAQSPSPQRPAAPVRSVTVPFQFEHNGIFIELTFTRPDGSDRKARCVIAPPAAAGWAITEPLARELGLDLSGERGEEGGMQFVAVKTPPVRLGNMNIGTNDLPSLYAILGQGKFLPYTDAECLWNVLHLRSYYAKMNCATKEFTLAEHGTIPPKDVRLSTCAPPKISEWVYFDSSHHLHYKTDEQGNRIMDFSHAGYGGGGVRLPDVGVAATLSAMPGDNTARIQRAIDKVSKQPLDAKGFRGAVLLKPGTYDVAGMLRIAASGVVLRGSGSEEGGTTIRLTGPPHRLMHMEGRGLQTEEKASVSGPLRKKLSQGSLPTWQMEGKPAMITDEYVPSGADSFLVNDPSGFHVGDSVLIRRPVTKEWVHFMGMDVFTGAGKPETWIEPGTYIQTDRTIQAIEGHRITLDVPFSDSLDAQYLKPEGATMVRYTFPARISQVGMENMRVVAPSLDVPISQDQYSVLLIAGVIDGWARDIAVEETMNVVAVEATAKRITLDSIREVHKTPHTGGAAPGDFGISGTQVFVNRCSVSGDGTWPLITQARVTGPNAVLNFVTDEWGVSPHQRWATGLLVDSSTFTNSTKNRPGIAFSNRGTSGSGHGWDVGWAVAWNVTAPYLLVQKPPGAMNWCIGCTGQAIEKDGMPAGTFDDAGEQVTPSSLYLEQLRERLGDAALANIGYP